jgi:hypothetical protein
VDACVHGHRRGAAALPLPFHATVPRTKAVTRASPWPISGVAPPPVGSLRLRAKSSRSAALS